VSAWPKYRFVRPGTLASLHVWTHIVVVCVSFFFQTSPHTKHSQRHITVVRSGGKKWSRPYPSHFLMQCWHRVFNKWANWRDGRKCYCWCWIRPTTSHLIDNTKRHSTKPQSTNLITHSSTKLIANKDRIPWPITNSFPTRRTGQQRTYITNNVVIIQRVSFASGLSGQVGPRSPLNISLHESDWLNLETEQAV
jgi:hypothetical protein